MPSPDVASIIERDVSNFRAWVATNPGPKGLDRLPSSAIRTLIPPRLYELVSTPKELQIVEPFSPKPDYGFFCIVHPNSNKTTDWLRSYWGMDTDADRKSLEKSRPNDVSPLFKHHYYRWGLVPFDRNILMTATLALPSDEVLHVVDIHVVRNQRKKGLGTSFYQQLREFCRNLGIKYITGENEARHIPFFVDKLGRKFVKDLPQPLQGQLSSTVERLLEEDGKKRELTVDILDPKSQK